MILASASAAVLVAAWVWVRFAHRGKTADELERQRRLDVNRRGRITSGRVVDFIEPEATPGARLVVYKYELAGVTYEAAQDLSTLPSVLALARHATDRVASVKYDPKVPTNSIIACEQWCGVPGAEAKPAPARASVAPVPKTQALRD